MKISKNPKPKKQKSQADACMEDLAQGGQLLCAENSPRVLQHYPDGCPEHQIYMKHLIDLTNHEDFKPRQSAESEASTNPAPSPGASDATSTQNNGLAEECSYNEDSALGKQLKIWARYYHDSGSSGYFMPKWKVIEKVLRDAAKGLPYPDEFKTLCFSKLQRSPGFGFVCGMPPHNKTHQDCIRDNPDDDPKVFPHFYLNKDLVQLYFPQPYGERNNGNEGSVTEERNNGNGPGVGVWKWGK